MAKAAQRKPSQFNTVIYGHCLVTVSKMTFGTGANQVQLSDADAKKVARRLTDRFEHFLGDNVLSDKSDIYRFQEKYDGFCKGLRKNGIHLPPEKLARIVVLAPNLVCADPKTSLGNLFGYRREDGKHEKGLFDKIRDRGVHLSEEDIERILVRSPQWAYLDPNNIVTHLFGGKDSSGQTVEGVFEALDRHFQAGATKRERSGAVLSADEKRTFLVRHPAIAYQRRTIHNLFGRMSADGTHVVRLGLYEHLARLGAKLDAKAKIKILAEFPQLASQTAKASINHYLLKQHIKFISNVRGRTQAAVNGQDLTNGTSYYLFGICACEIIGDKHKALGPVNDGLNPAKDGILRSLSYLKKSDLDDAIRVHFGIDASEAERIREAAALAISPDGRRPDRRYRISAQLLEKLRKNFIRAEEKIADYSRARLEHGVRQEGKDRRVPFNKERPNAVDILFDKNLVAVARTEIGKGVAKQEIVAARRQLYFQMHVVMNMRHRHALNAA